MLKGFKAFRKKYKRKHWYIALKTFVKLCLHFGVVMCCLLAGSAVFAILEEPPLTEGEKLYLERERHVHNHSTGSLILELKSKYNLTNISDVTLGTILTDVEEHRLERQLSAKKVHNMEERQDRMMVVDKWFYFTTIAAMTIGYGDVYPVTDNGKIFFILFMLITIPLTMTLLMSCGEVISTLNKSILKRLCINRFQLDRWFSEESLSSFSLIIVFTLFWCAGAVINVSVEQFSWVDAFYFWFVTLSTVGLGDITMDHHAQEPLLPYRLFGLALLSGIINSIVEWIRAKNKRMAHSVTKKMRRIVRAIELRDFGVLTADNWKELGPLTPDDIVLMVDDEGISLLVNDDPTSDLSATELDEEGDDASGNLLRRNTLRKASLFKFQTSVLDNEGGTGRRNTLTPRGAVKQRKGSLFKFQLSPGSKHLDEESDTGSHTSVNQARRNTHSAGSRAVKEQRKGSLFKQQRKGSLFKFQLSAPPASKLDASGTDVSHTAADPACRNTSSSESERVRHNTLSVPGAAGADRRRSSGRRSPSVRKSPSTPRRSPSTRRKSSIFMPAHLRAASPTYEEEEEDQFSERAIEDLKEKLRKEDDLKRIQGMMAGSNGMFMMGGKNVVIIKPNGQSVSGQMLANNAINMFDTDAKEGDTFDAILRKYMAKEATTQQPTDAECPAPSLEESVSVVEVHVSSVSNSETEESEHDGEDIIPQKASAKDVEARDDTIDYEAGLSPSVEDTCVGEDGEWDEEGSSNFLHEDCTRLQWYGGNPEDAGVKLTVESSDPNKYLNLGSSGADPRNSSSADLGQIDDPTYHKSFCCADPYSNSTIEDISISSARELIDINGSLGMVYNNTQQQEDYDNSLSSLDPGVNPGRRAGCSHTPCVSENSYDQVPTATAVSSISETADSVVDAPTTQPEDPSVSAVTEEEEEEESIFIDAVQLKETMKMVKKKMSFREDSGTAGVMPFMTTCNNHKGVNDVELAAMQDHISSGASLAMQANRTRRGRNSQRNKSSSSSS